MYCILCEWPSSVPYAHVGRVKLRFCIVLDVALILIGVLTFLPSFIEWYSFTLPKFLLRNLSRKSLYNYAYTLGLACLPCDLIGNSFMWNSLRKEEPIMFSSVPTKFLQIHLTAMEISQLFVFLLLLFIDLLLLKHYLYYEAWSPVVLQETEVFSVVICFISSN
jgi:hypothetical protein